MGLCPVAYDGAVARWEANPRERLAYAALDLFAERGYDKTTVADIAERAGLTKSTFFRHFDDKRAVLFGGQEEMIGTLEAAVAAVPDEETPRAYVAALLDGLAAYFPAEHRSRAATRSATIAAHPELRERELLKREELMAAIENALRSRGVDDVTASLAAMVSLLAFGTAFSRWSADRDSRPFSEVLAESLQELVSRMAVFGEPTRCG
jgi:AcrR family transcriptional regulator